MPTPRTRSTPDALPHPNVPLRQRGRRLPAGAAGATLTLAAAVALAGPASATTASGPEGQTVTVSKSDDLDPDGETITVEGSGFDLNKGIYVVLCVNNGAGQQPTPCLGGVDMEGAGGSSAWISSNPPSYGEGLAQPFDEVDGTGSFSVQLNVAAQDEFTDCLDESVAPRGCVVGTRADHTRTADRSADVLIPVTFTTDGSGDEDSGDDGGAQGTGDDGSDGADTSGDADGSGDDGGAQGSDDGTGAESAGDDLAETGAPVVPAAVAAVALLGTGGAVLATQRVVARRRLAGTR